MKNQKATGQLAVLCAAPALLLGAPSITRAATYNWTGASGTDWHNAGNWAPRGVPGPADSAVIDSRTVEIRRDTTVGNLSLGAAAELKNGGRLTVKRATSSRGLVVGLGSVNIPAGASASFSISPATVAAALARLKAEGGGKGLGKGSAISFQAIKNRGVLRALVATSARLSFDSIENTGTTAIAASGQVSFKSIQNLGVLRLTVLKSKASKAALSAALSRAPKITLSGDEAPVTLGDVVNAPTGQVVLSGSAGNGPDFLANTIQNQGQMQLKDATTIVSTGLTNAPNGVLTLDGATSLTPEPGQSPQLLNQGTILKQGDDDASVFVEWVNNGQVSIGGGTLLLQAPSGTDTVQLGGATTLTGGTLQVLAADGTPGTLVLQGGILNGSGTIEGNVENGADVSIGFSPGIISINGNFTQTTNGTLNMEVGGLYPGTGYDQLVVNGRISLAGTLKMLRYGPYVPVVGASFQLLKFWSIQGNFGTTYLSTPVATYAVTLGSNFYIARCVSRSAPTASSEVRPPSTWASPTGRLALAPDHDLDHDLDHARDLDPAALSLSR